MEKQKPSKKEIDWVSSVTGLGTEFGHNINFDELWLKQFAKFKEKIIKWKNRDLTFKGKKLLINSYIMSSISYLCDICTANISERFIKETKDLN